MNRICPITIPCPGSDDPITNLSSEASDGPEWIGMKWPVFNPRNNPFGWNGFGRNTPLWWSRGCLSLCVSTASQQDADNCADNQALQCSNTPPPGEPGIDLFSNTEQMCVFTCANGTQSIYVMPAGSISATDQATADNVAYAQACSLAALYSNCSDPPDPQPPSPPGPALPCTLVNFSDTLANGKIGEVYSATLTPTAGQAPFIFTLVGGSLPDGLTLGADGTLSGTPTIALGFAFTVMCTDALGRICIKNAYITIEPCACFSIQNPLPEGYEVEPYNVCAILCDSVVIDGGYNAVFSVISGELPDGLHIDPSGCIVGTPEEGQAGTYNFTVEVTQELGGGT